MSTWACAVPTLVAAALALSSTPANAAPLLPDIVADAPVGGYRHDVYSDPQGERLLLRLDGFVHNVGAGALDLRGSGPSNLVMTNVVQRVYDSDGSYQDVVSTGTAARMLYETSDGHDHWHLRNAMRYSLWSDDKAVEVAPSQKVGFCLLDSQRIAASAAARVYSSTANSFCGRSDPSAPSVFMGVSPGWRDVYGAGLTFQWIDISDVAPGEYWLRTDADPDNVFVESDEHNVGTYSATPSVVNGYLAQPVAVGEIPALAPSAINLSARKFDDEADGSPGPLQFQVVTSPAHGTLDQPAGTWFSATQVRYSPNLGWSGPDSFTVAARDATSAYPRNPPAAAVTLTVGSPPVQTSRVLGASGVLGISGAPESVTTSSTTRLTASGPGVAQGVTWSVENEVGGNQRNGTISRDGVYRAPAEPPPGARVLITATSATGATGAAAIRIVKAAARRGAPTVAAPPVPHKGISAIRLARHKRSLIAVVSSARYGRVRFVAQRGGTRIGGCSMIVSKRGAVTCSMPLPRSIAPAPFLCTIPKTTGLKLPGVTVTATLSARGKVVQQRRARPR
jgi:hypothetical protein